MFETNEIASAVMAGCGGILLGGLYFGGLWWTVCRIPRTLHPFYFYIVSLLVRLGEGTYTQRGFHDFDGYRQLLLGRVDAMVDPGVKAWDVCAAAVLVREAGGRFSSIAGEDTVHGGSALATNGRIHDALLDLLA